MVELFSRVGYLPIHRASSAILWFPAGLLQLFNRWTNVSPQRSMALSWYLSPITTPPYPATALTGQIRRSSPVHRWPSSTLKMTRPPTSSALNLYKGSNWGMCVCVCVCGRARNSRNSILILSWYRREMIMIMMTRTMTRTYSNSYPPVRIFFLVGRSIHFCL